MKSFVRNLSSVLIVASLVAGVGCSKNTTSEAQQGEASSDVTNAKLESTPKERALLAKEALFKRLSTELIAAMSNGGPSAAIEVCSQKAPKIAAEVGEQHGLSIGRTSFKLRNPANKPPAWAVPLVEQRLAIPEFLELENLGTGAFLPIHLKPQCLACHGEKDQIGDDVKQELAKRYPDDAATGFKDGDLRGWFWVEVPANIAVAE